MGCQLGRIHSAGKILVCLSIFQGDSKLGKNNITEIQGNGCALNTSY